VPHAELASAKPSPSVPSSVLQEDFSTPDAQGAAKRFLPFSAGMVLLSFCFIVVWYGFYSRLLSICLQLAGWNVQGAGLFSH